MEGEKPPEALAIGSSDIRFLLSSHSVDQLSQAKLFENGIDTLAKFAAFVTSEEELTKVLKSDFGLAPESSPKVRGQVASYLVSWQSAKTRLKCRPKPRPAASCESGRSPYRRRTMLL